MAQCIPTDGQTFISLQVRKVEINKAAMFKAKVEISKFLRVVQYLGRRLVGLQAPLVTKREKSALKFAVCAIWKAAQPVPIVWVSNDATV
jgi:hypothetical protein